MARDVNVMLTKNHVHVVLSNMKMAIYIS